MFSMRSGSAAAASSGANSGSSSRGSSNASRYDRRDQPPTVVMTSMGLDSAPTKAWDGVSPNRPNLSPNGAGTPDPADGMMTSTHRRVHASEATDTTAPAIHRLCRTMIQMPKMTSARPTCSLPSSASATEMPSTQSLRASAAQMASISSGAARVTACRSVTTAHWIGA